MILRIPASWILQVNLGILIVINAILTEWFRHALAVKENAAAEIHRIDRTVAVVIDVIKAFSVLILVCIIRAETSQIARIIRFSVAVVIRLIVARLGATDELSAEDPEACTIEHEDESSNKDCENQGCGSRMNTFQGGGKFHIYIYVSSLL